MLVIVRSYESYAAERSWFEFFVLLRRTALVGSSVLLSLDRPRMFTVICVLNLIFLCAHLLLR